MIRVLIVCTIAICGMAAAAPSPGRLAQVHSDEPRDARRDSANRRYLFSETVDGRDALGPQLRERRADGETLHGGASATLSRQAWRIILSSTDELFRAAR